MENRLFVCATLGESRNRRAGREPPPGSVSHVSGFQRKEKEEAEEEKKKVKGAGEGHEKGPNAWERT